ncbi:hypothetical protein C0991_000803 [Blastosporella zonata]|nr:hypothetical protein C0991_000803 [Blastosporella zonata]
MPFVSSSPPRAPPIKYTAPLGTRWDKEKAAAGGIGAFDLPTDPKSIGPWILGECVGKGASGRVKIAKHRITGQLAAVKILPVAPLVNSRASLATQQAKSDKQRLGIDREITMMKLMNHPNIMRIYDVYEGDKELFLVLEYIEGGELFDFLVNRGRLPPSEALAFFKQIIYGLNYAHTFSIIHRDLKPENILIASISPPLIKIADWGMAAFAHPSLQLDTSCGSPHYASPEIVNGQSYKGNSTDIWSCGVILFALLTGRLPFDDKNVRVLLGKVKSGKYDMPTWIDPLAKDLLEKMLVVEVEKRITIPDILSHPWLHPPSKTMPFGGIEADLAITQLPPSPSTLARPIDSPSLIDPELLTSLRVIWGRHTDANGDSIKRDLCLPAGQGVHAKAFYFLLARYREESMRNNLEANMNGLDGELDVGSMKFNLGWELDLSTVNKKYEGFRNDILGVEMPANSRLRSPAPVLISGLVPPADHHAGSTGGARERASSAGPRAPPHVAGRASIELWRAQTQGLDDWKFKSSMQPAMTSGVGRGGPRPPPSRRGYTYSHPNPEKVVSTLQFPKQLQAQDIVNLQRRSSTTGPLGPRRSSLFVTSPNPSRDRPDLPMAAIPTPSTSPTGSPIPSIYAPVPIPIPAPKPALEIDMMIDSLQVADKETPKELLEADIAAAFTPSLKPSPHPSATAVQNAPGDPPVATRGQRVVSVIHDGGDKENQGVGEEGWSYVESEEPKGRGLGFGGITREAGRTMGNVTNAPLAAKGKKDKEKKIRRKLHDDNFTSTYADQNIAPTLDFRNLQQKRSTVLGSPILLSPPFASPTLSRSPVVGEVKEWFSNLFNWKHHINTQGGVLYSANSILRTRAGVGRLLEGLGVIIEGGGFGRGMTPADFTGPLKCRVEDPSGSRTPYMLKSVRFRVEFSVALAPCDTTPSMQPNNLDRLVAPVPVMGGSFTNGSGHTGTGALFPTPRMRDSIMMSGSRSQMTSPLPDAEFPPGSACAIYMAYEKGSMSSFRVIWRRLKEAYGGGAAAAVCPSCSPAMASTPMTEHSERLAI